MIKRKPGAGSSGDAPSRRGNAGGSGQAAQLALVRELARIAAEFELEEIELEPAGRIRICRRQTNLGGISGSPSNAQGGSSPLLVVPPAASPSSSLATVEEGAIYITSPFVGTFYRSPSPEAGVFADVGQDVRKGQVVCIIEAMKLMNEIESEVDGKVTEVLVKNGEHVEYGQPLFRLAKV
jgi:acetyl-CoA carboxylase biotin carboxyl carrier protein